MALVRGEGEASDANRLRLADCDGVQVIAEGEPAHAAWHMPCHQRNAALLRQAAAAPVAAACAARCWARRLLPRDLHAAPAWLQACMPTWTRPWCSCLRCCAWCRWPWRVPTSRCSSTYLQGSFLGGSSLAGWQHRAAPGWHGRNRWQQGEGTLTALAAPSPPLYRLQVLVARCCLPAILAAMQRHLGEVEVVSKAMITLGVLDQVSLHRTPASQQPRMLASRLLAPGPSSARAVGWLPPLPSPLASWMPSTRMGTAGRRGGARGDPGDDHGAHPLPPDCRAGAA